MLRKKSALLALVSVVLVLAAAMVGRQMLTQPVAVEETATVVTAPTAVITATPSPEEIQEARAMLAEIFGGFEPQKACNGAYIIGTVLNADQAQQDAQVYYAELIAGRRPETTSLQARQNAQTLLKVGLAACRLAPVFNELFSALAEPTEEVK